MVRAAPRIRAKRTSTPPSPGPQKALQKSRLREEASGDVVRANFASEVVDDCRLADIMRKRCLFNRRGLKTQQLRRTAVDGWQGESPREKVLAMDECRRRRRRFRGCWRRGHSKSTQQRPVVAMLYKLTATRITAISFLPFKASSIIGALFIAGADKTVIIPITIVQKYI